VTRGAADLRARASEDARVARDRPAVLLQVASGLTQPRLSNFVHRNFLNDAVVRSNLLALHLVQLGP
jgi:hypothetical protein